MSRRRTLTLVPLAAGLLLAVSLSIAQAALPQEGTVVEGVSVPGIGLGAARSEVEASYGSPSFCQGPTQGYCSYNISGIGQVDVRYRAADGSPVANGTPDDEAYNLRWSGLPGWETTVGVTTANAVDDPDFVIAAYPEATVQYNQFGIYNVVDRDLGIEVIWIRNLYTGTVHASMNIFAGAGANPGQTPTATVTATPSPTPSPTATPQVNGVLHVDDITMSTRRGEVSAVVRIEDQGGTAVRNARVTAEWTFPNGSRETLTSQTSESGRASFSVDSARGWHRIDVVSVSLDGYAYNGGGVQYRYIYAFR